MAINVKYVLAKRLSDGSTAYYWNPPLRYRDSGIGAVSLGKEISQALQRAAELNGELDAWRTGNVESKAAKPYTVAWLRKQYEATQEYKSLAIATQTSYQKCLKVIEDELGLYDCRAFKKPHARKWYGELLEKRGVSFSAAIMRIARLIFGFAVGEGYRLDNPFSRLKLKTPDARQERWTPELVNAFKAKAIELGKVSMAVAVHLSYDLCQRESDVIGRFERRMDGQIAWSGMSWHNVHDGKMILRQNKTGEPVAVPLKDLPETRAMLENLKRTSTAIVAHEGTGAPYKADHFRHEFREIANLAGIPNELQFRDLRRTGLSELGDAGATDDELRAVSGHKTRNIVSTYVVPSSNQAKAAMVKRAKMRATEKRNARKSGGAA